MSTIRERLQAVKLRIAAAAHSADRDPTQIRLLAVSKSFSASAVREAAAAGQRDFGENYAQEGVSKILACASLSLGWHYIGPIQSNKTGEIATHFDWVHSIDRLKIAERLAAQRPEGMHPLDICVQVNVGGEATKGGVEASAAEALARAVSRLPRLRLRGLMAIPRPTSDVEEQRAQFRTLAHLQHRLIDAGLPMDTLSMGMSDDLEAAIAEGATLVRVGRAIFGPRRVDGRT